MKALGSIVWYSVTGTVARTDGRRRVIPVRVNHDELEKWFEECDLDTRFVPSTIKRIDAWRTATGTRVKHSYVVNGKTVELRIEEVEIKDDFVTRHMVRTVRGSSEKTHVATLKFIRGGRTARGKRHSGDHWRSTVIKRWSEDEGRQKVIERDRKEVQQFLDEIDEHYTDLSANLHETKVRGILRDYLVKRLHALPVRAGGGVYFVHLDHQKELENLQKVVLRMGGACRLEQHPLVESPRARQMVLNAMEEKVEDEVRVLLEKVEAVLEQAQKRKQRVPFQKFTEFRGEYTSIATRCERYVDVLGMPQQRANESLEMALEAVDALKTRLDIGGGR